jgi:hypothetical protein
MTAHPQQPPEEEAVTVADNYEINRTSHRCLWCENNRTVRNRNSYSTADEVD